MSMPRVLLESKAGRMPDEREFRSAFSAAEMLGINKQFAPWLHIQSHLSLALGGGHVYLSRISISQMFDHI